MALKKSSPIVQIVKKTLPSVVSITCSTKPEGSHPRFKALGLNYPLSEKKKTKVTGGSGFIADPSGIVLTNRHVVENPKADYSVILQNGEKYRPEILAKDPINDIAILKISVEKELPALKLGDSSRLELGEEVVAIGNALGIFKNTVSSGIVSGLSRIITAQSDFSKEQTKLKGLIQTDAAINPGNSGGPLVDISGKVIGINAAMVFGAENIGFALPINNAKKDLDELKKYGRIRKRFLGVRYLTLNNELKKKFNLPVDFGALIIAEPDIHGFKSAVIPGSPAAKAGLREGDIILEMGDKKITPETTVSDVLQEFKLGEPVHLKVLRGVKEKKIKLVLSEKN